MLNINVLIEKEKNILELLPVIKRFSGLGFGELKRRIETNSPIIEMYEITSYDTGIKIKSFIKEILDLGGRIRVFEVMPNSKQSEITFEYMNNRIERLGQIMQHNQDLDDLMYGDE